MRALMSIKPALTFVHMTCLSIINGQHRCRACWTLEEAKQLCLDEEHDEKLKVAERSKNVSLKDRALKASPKKILHPPEFQD